MASWQGMKRVLASLLALAACGADPAKPPPPDPSDILGKRGGIPGVTADQVPTDTAGYTYFVVHFTQPVDHDAPDGQTFQQEVSLLHKGGSAPMIVRTSGY